MAFGSYFFEHRSSVARVVVDKEARLAEVAIFGGNEHLVDVGRVVVGCAEGIVGYHVDEHGARGIGNGQVGGIVIAGTAA